MARDIKFTPFGVPYILEFENVSVVPEQPPPVPPSPASSTSSFCYIDSPPPPDRRPAFSLRPPTSLFKRKPTPPRHVSPPRTPNDPDSAKPTPPPPPSDVPETNGIYIRFPPGCCHLRMARKERLVHLQQTISVAVLNAGMSRSPGNAEKHADGSRGYRTPDALFCGTYGQMMAALEGTGLSATPCAEDASRYTRLGAIFVARNDGGKGVQLRKITLWG